MSYRVFNLITGKYYDKDSCEVVGDDATSVLEQLQNLKCSRYLKLIESYPKIKRQPIEIADTPINCNFGETNA